MTIDLTGVWHCDDGGTYYIRHLDPGTVDLLYWYGESPLTTPPWPNIGTGAFYGSWFMINWKNIPYDLNQSEMLGGVLIFDVISNENKLTTNEKNGAAFPGSNWWRSFIANSKTKEVHVFDCEWALKISKHHQVPYNSLEQAIKEGYNGCYYCLPEYDTG
jgi:hypothetical protein